MHYVNYVGMMFVSCANASLTRQEIRRNNQMKFVPCDGKCTDEGTHCEGCGRSHEEIAAMRKPVEALVALAEKMKYENTEDFANAVAGSIKYKMGAGH